MPSGITETTWLLAKPKVFRTIEIYQNNRPESNTHVEAAETDAKTDMGISEANQRGGRTNPNPIHRGRESKTAMTAKDLLDSIFEFDRRRNRIMRQSRYATSAGGYFKSDYQNVSLII